MLHSMTGFGHASATRDGWTLSVEVRSVNHRALDVRTRVPSDQTRLIRSLNRRVSERVQRGRVELSVTLVDDNESAKIEFDHERAAAIIEAARSFATAHDINPAISLDALIAVPGVVSTARAIVPDNDLIDSLVDEAVAVALDVLAKSRANEGTQLRNVLLGRLDTVAALTEQIASRAEGASARLRAALKGRIDAAGVVVDEQRLAQEVALLADKADVSEEFDRLRAHVHRARALVDDDGPVGRKLDFLCQELNREANTVGSKTQDAETAHVVVELKSEIERVREQVQNIE